MAIVTIQNWKFVPHDQIDDTISLNEQEKNGSSCIWSMFSSIFQYTTNKSGKYVKELSLSFPNLKTELKSSYWSIFYCLLFRSIVKIGCILFRPQCIILAFIHRFELKLSTKTKFDTLISNLKLNLQYDIVMTS